MKITDEKIQEIIKNRPTWVTTHEVSMAQEIFYARAEIKQLKANLKEARKLLGSLSRVCDIAHHGKHDRHSLAEQCPVEKRIDILLEKIKECIS